MLSFVAAALGFLVPLCVTLTTPQAATGKAAMLPDTQAGRRAGAFIEAFNSGSAEAMRTFEEANRAKSALQKRTVEDRLKQFEELKADWGKLEAMQVTASEERSITVIVHTTVPDAQFEFQFVLEEAAPFGLDHIKIQGPVDAESRSGPARPLTSEERSSMLEGIAKALETNYVFPEMGSKMAAMLREKAAAKAYEKLDAPSELARYVTEDLREICKDKHLAVRVGPGPNLQGGGPMRRRGSPDDARRENFGFKQVEVLPGNIGYIRFDEFNPSEEAKHVAKGAMAFVSGCDALIFDLRYNGGGSPEMIRFLSSYLFDKPTHLNSFFDRTNNKTEESWTTETVPGKRLGENLPVYVLTSARTFSGAEEFSYNLQNLKRATLVGETTGGGAHPVRPFSVNEQFSVMVPYARAVNPITQTNWEGVGVKPQIEVEASQALERAKDLARLEIEKDRADLSKSN
jgi:hypothetical protein